MRHNVYGKKLGRNKNERTSLFRNLVRSLLIEEKIETTQAKAQAIKGLVDIIINQAKSPNTKRLVSQFLVNKKVEEKLEKDLLPKLKERTSGYTTVTKIGRRLGDGTMVVRMSLIMDAVKESRVKSQESSKKVEKKMVASDTKKGTKS